MNFRLTRRQILTGAALAAATGATNGFGRSLSALANVTLSPHLQKTGGDVLVALFLRGGADGLNILIPHGEDAYYSLRPNLALPRPNDRRVAANARALDLDGFFGLHPSLAPLLPFYKEGNLAPIHAVGSGDQTRSHFEAMATMERGIAADTGAASGWLARHLTATAGESDSPLRAVALADMMPDSLRGASNATSLLSLADYRLVVPTGSENKTHHAPPRTDAIVETLRGLYSKEPAGSDKTEFPLHPPREVLTAAGHETLQALDAVKRLDPANYRPAPGARYPQDIIGDGFRQAACLIKGEVGVEVAALNMGGWDTHAAQGRDSGWQPNLLRLLAEALSAFVTDLGPRMERVTVLVMTEFGRRAGENFSLGTDHGRASCMFLLGGGIAGGKVASDWPGLKPGQLDGGDLKVTTDYRDILAEVVARRLKNPNLTEVFPEYSPRFRHITRA